MCERLTGRQDGQPKVFRDSCIANFTEFFDRFRRLNVRSNPELDALVDQARQVITGIEPQQLRDSVRLRAMVANDFTPIEQAVGDLLVDRPRRTTLRPGRREREHERADRDGAGRRRGWRRWRRSGGGW